MADYIPVFKPGQDITQTAGAAIVGGRLVAVTGANTVTETSAATGAWLGVATQDAASGAKIGVTSGGVQEIVASAAITVGAGVMAAATGRVAPFTGTDYSQLVGVALTAATGAGQVVRVKMAR